MESLFIVNPRRKKRKGKMPAGLRRYWASRKRQKNPRRKRRRASAMVAAPVHRRKRRRNPISSRKRRRGRRAGSVVRYSRRKRRANPKYMRRSRRARRRNPIDDAVSVSNVLMPAAYGAAGALATNILYGYLAPSMPSTFTTGIFPFLVQAAAAIGIGAVVGMLGSKSDGQAATAGALTVVAVAAITPQITSRFPGIPGLSGLSGIGRMGAYAPYGAYSPSLAQQQTTRFGAYSASLARQQTSRLGRLGRLGFISPAPKLGAYMSSPMGRGMASGGDLSGSGFNGLNG